MTQLQVAQINDKQNIATVTNSLFHPFSFQCGLDQIKVFIEPLSRTEGTSTHLVSTRLGECDVCESIETDNDTCTPSHSITYTLFMSADWSHAQCDMEIVAALERQFPEDGSFSSWLLSDDDYH